MNKQDKPKGYENDLGNYALIFKDGICSEPVAWGFKIITHLGQDRFDALREFGQLECDYPAWYLITHHLTREEAIKKYGEITDEEFGPRGGWRSVTFGTTKFRSKYLKPIKT
jgi:hypothetical protein